VLEEAAIEVSEEDEQEEEVEKFRAFLQDVNPEARRQAVETLEELARLGQSLRGAMLRQLLRQYLEGPS
jgi:formate dehydrogenase maturation protein FdhE